MRIRRRRKCLYLLNRSSSYEGKLCMLTSLQRAARLSKLKSCACSSAPPIPDLLRWASAQVPNSVGHYDLLAGGEKWLKTFLT